MRTLPLIASIVTAAALAIPAAAQSTSGTTPRPTQHQNQKQTKNERFVQAMRKIGVDEARIRQVVAIHEKHASERQQLRQDARKHREALETLVRNNSTDEAAFQRALDGLEKDRKERLRLRDAERTEAKKVLKPSEQAKLLAMRRDRGHRAQGVTSPSAGKQTRQPRHARPAGGNPNARGPRPSGGPGHG